MDCTETMEEVKMWLKSTERTTTGKPKYPKLCKNFLMTDSCIYNGHVFDVVARQL